MKNAKLVLLSLITVLVLTGCGKKELNCSMSQSASGVDMNSTLSVKFDGDTIEDMSVSVDVVIPESLMEQKDLLKAQFEEVYDVEETDNGFKLTAGSDSKVFEDMDFSQSKTTYDEAKEYLEASGFTCK